MIFLIIFSLVNVLVAVSAIMLYRWWVRHEVTKIFTSCYLSAVGLASTLKSVAAVVDELPKAGSGAVETLKTTCAGLATNVATVGEKIQSFANRADVVTKNADDLITFASVWGAIIALIAIFPYFVDKLRSLVPKTVAESLPRRTSLDKLEKIAYVLAYFAGAMKLVSYLREWMRLDAVLVSLFDMSPGDLFDVLTFAKPKGPEVPLEPHKGLGFVKGTTLPPTTTTSPLAVASLGAGLSLSDVALANPANWPSEDEVLKMAPYDAKVLCARMSGIRMFQPHDEVRRAYLCNLLESVYSKTSEKTSSSSFPGDVQQSTESIRSILENCFTQLQESPRHFRLGMVLCLICVLMLSWYAYDRMQADEDDDEDETDEARRHFKQSRRARVTKKNIHDYAELDKPDPAPVVVGRKTLDPDKDRPLGDMLRRLPDKQGKYLDTKVDWAALAEEEQETKAVKTVPSVPASVVDAKKTKSQIKREKKRAREARLAASKEDAECACDDAKLVSRVEKLEQKESTMRDSKVSVVTGEILPIRNGAGDSWNKEGRAFCSGGYVVTAWHNLGQDEHGWVKAPDGKWHDIAFVKIGEDIAQSKKTSPFQWKSLKCHPTSLKIGDHIICRYSRDLLSPGQIVSLRTAGKRIEHNATTFGGWSGSPLVFGGTVVGVHVATNTALGVNVAEPLPLNFLAPGGFRSVGSTEPKRI